MQTNQSLAQTHIYMHIIYIQKNRILLIMCIKQMKELSNNNWTKKYLYYIMSEWVYAYFTINFLNVNE